MLKLHGSRTSAQQPDIKRMAPRFLRGALIAGITTVAIPSQVPDGDYAVTAYNSAVVPSGQGGIWVIDPRVPGPPQAITGLAPDLTGVGRPGTGAFSVAVRQSDGALYVGEAAASGDDLDLHVITLDGLAVATDTRIKIGSIPPNYGGTIDTIDVLPSGDLLIAVAMPDQPPFNGSPLGVVSTTNQTVTPIPVSRPPGAGVTAMATDGQTVYLVVCECLTPPLFPYFIYTVPITGGIPQLFLPTTATGGIAVHRDGNIYVSTRPVQRIDPVTKQVTVVGDPPGSPVGLDIERTTDDLVFPLNGLSASGRGVYRMSLSGESVRLATIPSGIPTSIAVRHDPWTYGLDTPAQSNYRWRTEPNPGGLPRIGNAQFGLHLDATPSGNAAGALLAASASGSTQVAGVELLLGGTIIFAGNVPASGDVPLPLPVAPALVGVTVYLQSFHLDPGGLAASNGVRMTVLQ
jgi:hypothetical protein